MKAMVYTRYGLPDVLRLEEVEKPAPNDDEALIKVHAASVNSWDWDLLRGKPLVSRIGALRHPRYKILGADVAGRVEAVGGNVTRLQQGDEVFGDLSGCGWGGFAEYVCAREDALALKPAGLTFEEAAAVPQAAVLALQGLRDKGQVQPGQKVLINGAGGGVGTFAVQIARSFGAEVTGVDSAAKLDLVRSLGAGQVIDYAQEDFTKNGQTYDLILDMVVDRSSFNYKRALRPGGTFVVVGGTTPRILQTVLLGLWLSKTGGKKMGILLHKPDPTDLAFMNELFESRIVAPVIDRRYPLSDVAEALRYFASGQVQGKIVLTI